MKETGREIHGQVEHSREAGNFLEALKLSEEAFLAYQDEGDIFGMGDILGSRSITYRLLSEQTGDRVFLIRAKHDAMAGLELAQNSSDRSTTIVPLYRLGQIQEELNELTDACSLYQKAVETFEEFPPKEHNRPAVLDEMKVRLFVCEFKTGNEASLKKAEASLLSLENNNEEVRYTKDVWTSGGHMKLAQALKSHDIQSAKAHLQKAKEIIESNPDLKLRKIQWKKIAASFE